MLFWISEQSRNDSNVSLSDLFIKNVQSKLQRKLRMQNSPEPIYTQMFPFSVHPKWCRDCHLLVVNKSHLALRLVQENQRASWNGPDASKPHINKCNAKHQLRRCKAYCNWTPEQYRSFSGVMNKSSLPWIKVLVCQLVREWNLPDCNVCAKVNTERITMELFFRTSVFVKGTAPPNSDWNATKWSLQIRHNCSTFQKASS